MSYEEKKSIIVHHSHNDDSYEVYIENIESIESNAPNKITFTEISKEGYQRNSHDTRVKSVKAFMDAYEDFKKDDSPHISIHITEREVNLILK